MKELVYHRSLLPGRAYGNLKDAVGTNDITKYFPNINPKGQKDPSRYVLNRLQREAAERLTADVGTGHWSAVTAQVHLAFEKVKVHPVPAQSFNPPPKVDSCSLVLRRRPDARRLSPRAREVARMLFTQRRKQVGSAAKKLFPGAADVTAWLADLPRYGLTSLARPEAIPAEAWLTL